jgi:hypothetical protein
MKTLITSFATQFKSDNAGKFVWFNGAMGLEDALLNSYIDNTREIAIQKLANRDGVSFEDVDNNYQDWYYILPIDDLSDDELNDFGNKYFVNIIENCNNTWQMK